MKQRIAVIGAGVSGLTCGLILAEHGHRVSVLADEAGQRTTSAVAAAIWFPYDAEPADKVIPWAIKTYNVLVDLSDQPDSGVSMIDLRQFSRAGEIEIPAWAIPLGASVIPSEVEKFRGFASGFVIRLPLTDTTIYLDYLAKRFLAAGGKIQTGIRFEKLEDVDPEFNLMINCSGIGARSLAQDVDLEPHRGQVVVVPRINALAHAIVCDDSPLMYAIPRANDCVLGGTNDLSDNLGVDPRSTERILAECSRVLAIEMPRVLGERVGLRPFRKSGVRLERCRLRDGRAVIHNYGHGGSGFTLSWGCAQQVLDLAVSN